MSSLRTSQIQNLSGVTVVDASSSPITLSPTIFQAGSTSVPPIQLTSGSYTTNPLAGSIEYASNGFSVCRDTISGRANLNESYIYSLASDYTQIATVVASTFYNLIGVSLPVDTGTYFFDGNFGLKTGTTSHTVSFTLGGTATIGSIFYSTEFLNLALSTALAAPGTPTASVDLQFSGNAAPVTAANSVISPASTLASKAFKVSGLVVVTGSGTINPQIAYSANPTGTNQTSKLSYFRLTPLGSSALPVNIGKWS